MALFVSCANPSITTIRRESLQAKPGASIYVARFEGNPDFVDDATDMFIAQVRSGTNREIIQGDAVRTEGTDIQHGGNIAARDQAIAAANKAGAGVLIVGKVTSHKTESMMNGFVTVRLFDVATGQALGTVHRPSGLLIGYSEHQAVMAASKRVAKVVTQTL